MSTSDHNLISGFWTAFWMNSDLTCTYANEESAEKKNQNKNVF